MPIEQLKQLPGWSIEWNRVRRWSYAIPRILPLFVGDKFAAQVVVYLVVVLLLVHTIGRCLPNIDLRARQWLLGLSIHHSAVHVDDLRIFRCVEGNASSLFSYRVVLSEEGSKDGALGRDVCCFRRLFVGDFVHQSSFGVSTTEAGTYLGNSRFKTDDVTNQLSFVSLLIAHLSGPVDEGHPF